MYLIEGDYYVNFDDRNWILSKKVGTSAKGEPVFRDLYFFQKPEQVLNEFLHLKQVERLSERTDGTIRDMVDILIDERKRLEKTLKSLFSTVCDFKGEDYVRDKEI